MFKQILESFLPKVGELLVDYAQNKVTSIKDLNVTFKSLQRNLESLSAKASDIEEQVKNAELSGKKKRKREVEDWLTNVKSIETEVLRLEKELQSKGLISRFFGGGRAAELNQRVDGLVEQSRNFGELLLDETKGELLSTTRLVGKEFEINLKIIRRFLETDRVSRIGLYGMGGVGKTTLMKHIHNRLLEKTQEYVFWVTISQVFTVKKLQDEIAHAIHLDLSDEVNEDKRAARLHRALLSLKKNTILMLDDVWEKIDLEKVGYPYSVESCRLILTTRSLGVCRQIGCQEVIAVKTLQTDEAWHLFNETLGKETKLTPPVEKIAKDLAKCCDGLPLGIIVLAGSMRGETAEHAWRNALEELKEPVMGQGDMEVQVFKVLKYSFDRLNPNHERQGQSIDGYNPLQLCFLCCSLYPEDCEIKREELVRRFISEELMDKRPRRKAQLDLGHSILDKLVNVCLLERTFNYAQELVKMHDLVRAMALKITKHKTRVTAGDRSLKELPREEEWTKDLEKMSLMKNGIEEIPPGISPNCPKLSTLILRFNPLRLVSDSFFLHMHGLCILDVSRTNLKELPNSLSGLTRLKALLLSYCRFLEYVPYLGKLKALRELDLSHTGIKEVPQGIEELVSLKFLSLYVERLEMIPTGLLLKLSHLQFLEFPVHIEAPIKEIEGLKQVEEFRGAVKDFSGFNRFIRSRESDTSYCIIVGIRETEHLFSGYNQVSLYNCNFKKGEGRDESMLGEDIQHLIMRDCEGLSDCLLDDFPRFGNPRSLKSLELRECKGIECILKSEHLMASDGLQSVERILLWELENFRGVIHMPEMGDTVPASPPPGQGVFSSLTHSTVYRCDKVKKLGLPLSVFQNLETLAIYFCGEIEEMIDDEGSGEGEARVVSLPKLKLLTLYGLPKLKSICNATVNCTSIESITVSNCPKFKKLPLHEAPPPTLREISMHKEDWESLEWEDPNLRHLLQPFLGRHFFGAKESGIIAAL